MKRYILALTRAEMENLRASLAVELDSGHLSRADVAPARRAIAKIDAAEEISAADFDALDWCAGSILDTGERVRVKGDPYRARDVIRKALRFRG